MLLAYVLLTHVSVTAVAQTSAPPPTPDKSIDARGVDVITGKYYAPWPSISIGQPGTGGLTYVVAENSVLHDSLFGALNSSGSDFVLTYMGISSRWTKSGSTFLPADGQGGSLTFNATTNQYTYRTPEGSTVIIDKTYDQNTPTQANEGRVTSVTHPTGETLTYQYDTIDECIFWVDDQCSGWLEAIRPMALSSSLGYRVKYEYETDTFGAEWMSPSRVLAINSTVDDCVPSALQCTGLTKNWPSLSFSNNESFPAYGGTITDNLGRSYVYTATGAGVTGVQFPGSLSNDISVVYMNGRVSSLTAGAETWTYAYSDSGSIRTTSVMDSGGHMAVTRSDINTLRVTSHENKAGAETTYQYDSEGRLTRITQPEGNYVEYQFDSRGNIDEIRRVAKPGAGLSDIVVTLNFPATCSNPVTCNKPTAVTDPRGNTTSFTYNATHGGVTKVESPAVGGVRRTTTYTYSSLPAYSGSVWRQTTIRACATAATCTDSVNEQETNVSYTANSRLPSQVNVRAGDESGTASITAVTYNHNDDPVTIDGPLTGTTDTVYLRYDDLRRQVGVIGPDPDGGGALKRRATRVTFNNRGLTSASEWGTVTGVSDSHWSAFASLLKETMEYDSHGRLTNTTVTSIGTTHTVTQYSYDGEGRPECLAFRMNPSSFGALPGACTASTLGSFGPDRISRTSYDMADRVNKVTTAYGTSVAADLMQDYTANGLISWIEDGNGNRSTYEYDGFDRLAKLRYPHPTSVGTSSSSDYDAYTYDAGSNVTQQRLRDGQIVSYTYDDLGRVTLRDSPGSTNDQTFTYDLLGRILSVAISGHTNSFSYNALGQMMSATSPLGTVSYQYDSGGRRNRVTYPDSFYVQYDHDATGAMTKARENGATSGAGLLAVYGYDDLGRRTSVARGNGVITTYDYDAASRLASLTHDLPGSGSDLTVTFDHNPAGQITSRTASNDLSSWIGQTSSETTTAVDGRNQITSQGGLSFSYDTPGEHDIRRRQYVWL
jgi:YD repeat-containing protein